MNSRDDAMHKLGIGTMHNMKSVVSGVFSPVMNCRAYTVSEKNKVWRAKAFLKNSKDLSKYFATAEVSDTSCDTVISLAESIELKDSPAPRCSQ